MKAVKFIFQGEDGKRLTAYKWVAKNAIGPKAIIQISHGMSEGGKDYQDFIKPFLKAGYGVYANDYRGHGENITSLDEFGYFGDHNGWNLVVGDMHQLTKIIAKDHPNIPIYLFGYSLGSLLTRHYISQYPHCIHGAILCGTYGGSSWPIPMAMGALKLILGHKGKKTISPFLNSLSFRPNKGPLPLPSMDRCPSFQSLHQYYKIGFYYDLLYGLQRVCRKNTYKNTPKELPIFLFSGEKDPIGNHTRGVLKVYRAYKKAGIKNIHYQFYKNTGHEIYNKESKEQVVKDILDCLKDWDQLNSKGKTSF